MRAASSATAASSSSGVAPSAASVATRRSDASESASRRSWCRECALATATAARSAKSRRRVSAAAASGSARLPPTHISPHTAPSTTIGAATSDPIAESRTAVPARPPRTETSSTRTGRPEAMTDACSPGSSSGQRLPIGNIGASSEAMTVVDRSASIRSTAIASTSIAWATARATAANRSLGDEPSATSVATCLKAPCSPASRRSAPRADASATATETSSAKLSTQASASARECSCGRAQRTPHVTPSTTTGDVSDDPSRLEALARPAAAFRKRRVAHGREHGRPFIRVVTQ